MFASYLTTWLRELCEWVGFYTGEHREQWKGFQKSLEQLRDTGVQPRQGEVQVHGGLNAWWQTHTECFTQEKSADNHSWQRATESRPKRPRQAGPGVLQGVQELIAELVEKGYRRVYTDGSSKRLSHKDMRRAGGFWRVRGGRRPRTRGALLWLRTNALQANKQRSRALGSRGSPTGILGAKTGNPHRLALPAAGSDWQGPTLEVKGMDNHIWKTASPRPSLGNAAPGNGDAGKRSQVGT